jgi:hypothetical protein
MTKVKRCCDVKHKISVWKLYALFFFRKFYALFLFRFRSAKNEVVIYYEVQLMLLIIRFDLIPFSIKIL